MGCFDLPKNCNYLFKLTHGLEGCKIMLNKDRYNWFSIPIEVKNIPINAEFVPVSYHVDFRKILDDINQPGMIDERSLRLFRIESDGAEIEEKFQFSPDIQQRHPKRPISSEGWHIGEEPAGLGLSGFLTWIGKGRVCKYKLVFGIPKDGFIIQAPFLPNNFRHFDKDGRSTPVRWFPTMQLRPQWRLDGVINVLQNENLFTTYHVGPISHENATTRRPYFYPVNGSDGISLTELGKPHDPTGSHAHHYSLWIAHANIDGADFWSEKGGLICHEQFELMEDGPIFARLIQKNRWIIQGETKLLERRILTFYDTPEDFRLMDVDLELSANGSKPVELVKTPFGFLAARVAQSMTAFDGGGEIINSNGQRNEQYAHWKRAQWIDQSGPIAQDKWGGIALMDHPDNPDHPTQWHCRNDGWAGASFNLNKSWIILPGTPLKLKYRVHLHKYDALGGEVARRYEEYALKPNFTDLRDI